MTRKISRPRRAPRRAFAALLCGVPFAAHASLFSGDTLDAVANGVAWVAIVIAPIVGIVVFWLLHIMPEKIAEKKNHPQTGAIQTLCLLSLFFGGLLWPIAWLWAYTKPVAFKAAYGYDEVDFHTGKPIFRDAKGERLAPAAAPAAAAATDKTEPQLRSVSQQVAAMESERELERLRRELVELKRQLGSKGTES